jgi:hypothetical protein
MFLFFICREEDEKNVSDKNVSISQSETLAKDHRTSPKQEAHDLFWSRDQGVATARRA